MPAHWFWSLWRFGRDVIALMAATLVLVAALALLQRDWAAAVIQGILYAGSVLFVLGMGLWGLQLFSTVARRGLTRVPGLWQPWYLWGPRVLVAGFLVFLLGLWLQGMICLLYTSPSPRDS
mgnify:CR=1 FL=1